VIFHLRVAEVPIGSAEETQLSGNDIGVKVVGFFLGMRLQEVREHLLAVVVMVVAQQANVDADDGGEAVGVLCLHVLPELLEGQPEVAHQARDAKGATVVEIAVCVVVLVVLGEQRELGSRVLVRLGAAGVLNTVLGTAWQADVAQGNAEVTFQTLGFHGAGQIHQFLCQINLNNEFNS